MKRFDARKFCICSDYSCPFNPVNHGQVCTPCIVKNLKLGKIPTCFFKQASAKKPAGYSRKDFVRFVLAHPNEK